MCAYLKNMEGYKLKDLKLKEFDSIQEMFDRAFKRVNTFEDFRTELVKGKEKRAGTELLMKIIPDEDEVAIDAIPLAVKSLSIVGWKIYKEGRKSYNKIIRVDGKSQIYMFFSKMLKSFNREDLEDLYKLVKAKYESTRPVEDLDLVLCGDLKTVFEPHVEDQMDLFLFIHHFNPTKVVIGERERAEGEPKLLTMTEGCVEHPLKGHDDVSLEAIAQDVLEFVIEKTKKPKRNRKITEDASGSHSEAKSFVRSPVADALVVTVAVTTTVIVDTSAIGDSALAGGVNADTASVSKLNKASTSSDSFYASQSLDTKTMHRDYVPKWTMTNDSILEDTYLYTKFNVGAARQVCLRAEVRMRAEHTLEKKEVEAAEAIRLDGQLAVVEATDIVKGNELRDLKEKNFALEGEC
ncbi:hypothetical protein Tco_1408295 [Tanacetum coccineum]